MRLPNEQAGLLRDVVITLGATGTKFVFAVLPWLVIWWPLYWLGQALAGTYARKQLSELMMLFAVVWFIALAWQAAKLMDEAGMDVLRTKGPAARVEDVTAAAGAAKGTFYVYFRTWGEFLKEVRDECNAMIGERCEELSKAYPDWRSLLFALSRLQVELVRELKGLEIVFYPPLADQITDPRDANLERTIFFLREAARAGAIDLEDAERDGRLVYAMMLQTIQAVFAGDDEEEACNSCGRFIVGGLKARPLPRTAKFWPEP